MATTSQPEPRIEIILEEYRTLRTEIINTQGRRLQIISFTIGAYSVILTILGRAIADPNMDITSLRLITFGGMTILWSFLVPSLMMIITTQRGIDRKGIYIKDFIEANIPELRWETVWANLKGRVIKNKLLGSYSRGGLYIFMTLLPLLFLVYAWFNCQPLEWWFYLPLILLVITLLLIIDYIRGRRIWEWDQEDWNNRLFLNYPDLEEPKES